MSARVNDVADAVVTRILAQSPAPDSCVRAYVPQLDRKTMSGRYVWVFGTNYSEAEKASRGKDWIGFRVAVVVAEKYAEATPSTTNEAVPRSWVDDRVEWVESKIFDVLRNERLSVTPLITGMHCETADVLTVFDADMLASEKVFWSELEFEFRELR